MLAIRFPAWCGEYLVYPCPCSRAARARRQQGARRQRRRGERLGEAMYTRPIPATGAAVPVIGCGTWRAFDAGSSPEERGRLAGVLRALVEAGGSVIDSSPMYGRAEAVVGALIRAADAHDKVFIATKVWTSGKAAG